ncbi:hypothetical protein NSMM_380060 [Nitrosomonas mobilis]|uniref:Uncharacterized protein n=1 Tax=Nitrosomonas mobilis TaxID=51642 RepID=A0A1G5SEA5_9PROT|nr:hypothetical protein NSMM_380060 [Nitrosomonas mobilis]
MDEINTNREILGGSSGQIPQQYRGTRPSGSEANNKTNARVQIFIIS